MQIRAFAPAFVSVLVLSFSALGFSQTEPADRLSAPIVASQRTVTNAVHPLAVKQNDLGRVNGGQVFHRMVLLLQRSSAQEAALQQLLKEQQDKTSPLYQQWLTPAQFGQRFGPSENDLAKITGWLSAQGFSVEKPSNGRQFIFFTGTSNQVEAAFQTEMHRYGVKGKTYFANAKPASIPQALAPAVRGMASLNSFAQMQPQYHLAANPNIKIGSGALTGPADLAAIYDAAPLQKNDVEGQGQSIALIEESNIHPQDVTDFRTITGLPAATVNVIVNGPDPGPLFNGEETEAIADVEYAGALAPDAALNVIVTASTELNQGIDLSTVYAVDYLVSPITSLSYGGCETLDDTYLPGTEQLYQYAYEQGAAEGISHFVSSGDYGGDACGGTGIGAGYGVNAIGSSPWNVSVGGTEFVMPDSNAYFPPPNFTATGYVPESTWNDFQNPEDGRPLAGGGGASIYYNSLTNASLGIGKPAWQTGLGVPADNARDVPDVSLVSGDNLAYMVCEADEGGDCSQGNAIGLIGTSLASPSWASIQALVNQKNNLIDGAGNPNPVYYQLAAGATSPFHDITVGDTKVPDDCILDFFVYCPGGVASDLVGYEATPGYDLATGLGSVDVNQLATNWLPPTGSGAATVTLSTGGVTSITHGDALTATVSVSSSGATVPTGDVVVLAGTEGVDRITLDATGHAAFSFGAASGIYLPGGSYSMTAQYAGDSNFAAGKSNSIALTVNPEATKTQAASSTTGAVPYGTAVTIAAEAFGVNSGSGYVVPGTYTFSEGTNTLGTATLAKTGEGFAYATKGATANLELSGNTALGAGTHQIIVASPPASASFVASVSAPVSIVVNKSPVLVSLVPNHTNPVVNSTVNLVVNVSSFTQVGNNGLSLNSVPITGNVDFYDTSTNPKTKLGTATLSGEAATLPVIFSAAGQHTLVAQYDGDANDLAGSSGTVDVTVGGKAPTSIIIGNGIDFTYAPTPIILQAIVTGDSAGAPTGVVTFTDATANNGAGATIGTVPLSSTGAVILSTNSLSAGTHSITASYAGDTNFSGSTSIAYQVSVISITLTPTPTSATVVAGQDTQPVTLSFATNSIFTNYYYSFVNFSCSGLPTGATCVFASTSVDPTYNSTTGVLSGLTKVAIYTTGPTLQNAAAKPPQKPWGGAATLALGGLFAIAFRRRRLFACLMGLIMLVFFVGLGGCGSSGGGKYNISSPGTAAGTYAVTVTGTMNDGGFGTFTTSTMFNLTVTAAGQ